MVNTVSFQKYDKNLMSKSVCKNLPLSMKVGVNIMHFIRYKKVDFVLAYLDEVIAMSKPMPYLIYKTETPHKSGMMAGKFPVKAAKLIKGVIENAKKNAIDKGFSTDLIIIHASALKGVSSFRYGRQGGKEGKSTTIEIVVEESKVKTDKTADKKSKTKKTKKIDSKEVKKEKEVKTENQSDSQL